MLTAVALLMAGLQAQPPAQRLAQARGLIESGKVSEGLAVLDQAVASPDPEVRFQAGKLLRELAERRFAGLQRAAPGSAPVHELAGRHHELRGRLPEALREYRAALAQEPLRPGLHYKAGNILWVMRDWDGAEAELRQELESNPAHGMANLRLGQVLLARNNEAQAADYLERAASAMPSSLEAHRELGKACRKLGRNNDARREWELVAKLRPADDQVHFLLANLYRELGDAAAAKREFEAHRAILERRRALAEKR